MMRHYADFLMKDTAQWWKSTLNYHPQWRINDSRTTKRWAQAKAGLKSILQRKKEMKKYRVIFWGRLVWKFIAFCYEDRFYNFFRKIKASGVMKFSIKFKQENFQDVSGINHVTFLLLNAFIFTYGTAEN